MSGNKYRTQIALQRVIDDFERGLIVEVRMSGWKGHRVVHLPASVFPEALMGIVECSPGPSECQIYIYANVNVRVESASELVFEGPWELSKVRHHEVITDETGRITDFGVERLEHNYFDVDGKFFYPEED